MSVVGVGPGGARNVNPWNSGTVLPSGFRTVRATTPGATPVGVVTRQPRPSSSTVPGTAVVPNTTAAPAWNPVPVTVTVVG